MSQISSEILHIKIPYPILRKRSKKTKKISETLITVNNVLTWKRFYETKIKAEFKQNLKEYYLPESTETYQSLHIEYRILKHNNRKIDPDSCAFIIKWFVDTMQETNFIKDDCNATICSFPTIHSVSLCETMIEIRVKVDSVKW